MDRQAYLDRIRYGGPGVPAEQSLAGLHRAHLMSVPFENLDIPLGREIILEENRLIDKVVHQGRGGFCYELNGAFALLLRELGFEVTLLSAAVAKAEGGFDPPFDHMALMVSLEQPWLVDVGFGDSFLNPIKLVPGEEQRDPTGIYRIIPENDANLVLERQKGSEGWQAQYRFDLQPHELHEFSPMCRHHQTSPESIFTQKRTATLARDNGRITLSGTRLIRTSEGSREERELASATEYGDTLVTVFGIRLSPDDVARLFETGPAKS